MTEKGDYLQSVDIFHDLSASEIEKIDHQTTMVHYRTGHIFFVPDDPAEVMFILKQGRVHLYRLSPAGRKLIVAELHPGTIFGHMALIGQHLHRTFAEACEDCLICVWNRSSVERLLLEQPGVALNFLHAMGNRLFDLEQRLEEATYKSIPARLAALLIRLDRQQGENGVVSGFTHQALADMLGTYRETTTQTLNGFKRNNLVRTGRKSIMILNEDGLRELAADKAQ